MNDQLEKLLLENGIEFSRRDEETIDLVDKETSNTAGIFLLGDWTVFRSCEFSLNSHDNDYLMDVYRKIGLVNSRATGPKIVINESMFIEVIYDCLNDSLSDQIILTICNQLFWLVEQIYLITDFSHSLSNKNDQDEFLEFFFGNGSYSTH